MAWWMMITSPEKHRPCPAGAYMERVWLDQHKLVLQEEHPDWSFGEPFEAPLDYQKTLPSVVSYVTHSDGTVYEVWSDGVEFLVE